MINLKTILFIGMASFVLVGCSHPEPNEEKILMYKDDLENGNIDKVREITLACVGKDFSGSGLAKEIRGNPGLVEKKLQNNLKTVQKNIEKKQDCVNIAETYYRQCLAINEMHQEHQRRMKVMGVRSNFGRQAPKQIDCDNKAEIVLMNAVRFVM